MNIVVLISGNGSNLQAIIDACKTNKIIMNIVVLISGNGSNLQAIIDACKTNKIKGTVRAVFSNKADAFGLERARQAGIATHTLITSAFDSREAYDRELIHEIDMYAPDVVVLAMPGVC